jgi:hypothetical protein
MGKRKAPRTSDKETQLAWREMMENHPFGETELSLTTILEAISQQVNKGKMNPGPAALESLLVIDRNLKNGKVLVEWWNEISINAGDHISIPIWAFGEIVDCWTKYVDGSSEFSLGDAFGVGQGQGKRKNTREGMRLFRRNFGLAFQVVMQCVNASKSGGQISLNKAYNLVADDNEIQVRKVERAYYEYESILRMIVRKQNLPIEF